MVENIIPFYSPAQADERFRGWMTREEAEALRFRFLSGTTPEFRTPDGQLIAQMFGDVFRNAEQEWRQAQTHQIRYDMRNRASVFDPAARVELLRIDEVTPTGRVGIPNEVLAVTAGTQILLGYNRRRTLKNGKALCELTRATYDNPEIYEVALADALKATSIMRERLPAEHATQFDYLREVPTEWRDEELAFTTHYGLRDLSTAFHRDNGNQRGTLAALVTAGSWLGNEFLIPEFKLAFDLRPSDLLVVDVLRLHGNLPRIAGHCSYFVHYIRRDMHLCPCAKEGARR